MSYAIAPTFEANKIGVRRVYTLGMFRGLGQTIDPDTESALLAAGYTAAQLNSLEALGATDEQLLNLPYPATQQEMDDAFQALMAQLSAASLATPVAMTTSPAGSAYSAAATAGNAIANTAFGTYDLTLDASWTGISNIFTMVQQQLNSIVQAQGGKPDADTINQIASFNQLVAEWAGYYQQAYGAPPPSIPFASATGLSGGLGVVPVVVAVALVAGVVVLLASLYAIYTWSQNKKNTLAAQVQTTAVTGAQASANNLLTQANALVTQANALPPAQSAQAAQIRAQAAAMQTQAAALLGQTVTSTTPAPAATTALTTWFTANWTSVALLLVALVALPPLLKKL